MNKRYKNLLLLVLGTFSATKVYFYGTLAISEAAIFLIAPIVFLRNMRILKQDGFLTFAWLIVGLSVSMMLSSYINHTPFPYVFKEFAVHYGWFCYFVVLHALLRNNYKGLGWLLVGMAISSFIVIFAFNPQASISEGGSSLVGESDLETLMSGPLFWADKLTNVMRLPTVAAYMQTPLVYSLFMPILLAVFFLLTTESARSGSLMLLGSFLFIAIGRKSRRAMGNIGKHFIIFFIMSMIAVVCYKTVYSYMAKHRLLSETATNKYALQTERGGGILGILMSGRKEFFLCFPVALDRPIVGYGPRPRDEKGYYENYIMRFGTFKEVEWSRYRRQFYMERGATPPIPLHSHIMGAWVQYGLFGLIFFIYYLYCIFRFLRKHLGTIPQWYGYFAITIPSMVWSIFFNPYAGRSFIPLLMVCMLFAKAVAERRLLLPYEMEVEAKKHV